MATAQQLSQAAFDRLKAEYDDLTTRGRIDIARKIEAARELGDLSENGDYHAAKEEQGKMEGRIMHLGRMIEDAVIVENEGGGDAAAGGEVVVLRLQSIERGLRELLGCCHGRRLSPTLGRLRGSSRPGRLAIVMINTLIIGIS